MNAALRTRLDEINARIAAEEAQRQLVIDNRFVTWRQPKGQQPCREVSDEVISAASRAMHGLLRTFEQDTWPGKKSAFKRLHNDEFGAELSARYEADHQRLCEETTQGCLDVLLGFARAHGVRFVSISKQDFYCFEDFQGQHWAGSHGRPLAWTIAERLDRHEKEFDHELHGRFWSGTGNGPQAQVSFVRVMAGGGWGPSALMEKHWGIYDLRGDTPVRVWAEPLELTKTWSDYVRLHYTDDVDLNAYLVACGANIPGYKRCPYRGSERFCGIVEKDLNLVSGD